MEGGERGKDCRHQKKEGKGDWRHGGGLGSAHCQLRQWTEATVAASKTFSQNTDAAQSIMPPTVTPLSGYLFDSFPLDCVFTMTAMVIFFCTSRLDGKDLCFVCPASKEISATGSFKFLLLL